MATSISRPATAHQRAGDTTGLAPARTVVPWHVYGVAAAATSVLVGITWDISWHMTIGRDTLWSPPHMVTYFAVVLVGISCGYLVIKTSVAGSPDERASSIDFWGLRAPLGAWVCIWGALAMLTSAPFDDWWHNAYGLDVTIVSPPHTVLSLGIVAIILGALLITLASQHRARDVGDDRARRRLERLFIYIGGVLLSLIAIYPTELTLRGWHHGSMFYRASSVVFPVLLLAAARASTMRWAATWTAAIYMGSRMIAGWILPLFPGEPRLGPIYTPVDHMIPLQFPLLLVAPAVAIDHIMQRVGKHTPPARDWRLAPAYGLAFLAALLFVQWPFATFLHSPAARNWFFFAHEFEFMLPADSPPRQYQFFDAKPFFSASLWAGLVVAFFYATISARAGLAWGRWMTQVRR